MPIPHILDHYKLFPQNICFPFHTYFKDSNGVYLLMNHEMKKQCAINDYSNLTDFDLPCLSYENAASFRRNDLLVMKSDREIIYQERGGFADGSQRIFISQKQPLRMNNKIVGVSGVSLAISEDSTPSVLTEQQEKCLLFLVKGCTAKTIASHLNLSQRTVEHLIERLKEKFNCFSKEALIQYALTLSNIRKALIFEFLQIEMNAQL